MLNTRNDQKEEKGTNKRDVCALTWPRPAGSSGIFWREGACKGDMWLYQGHVHAYPWIPELVKSFLTCSGIFNRIKYSTANETLGMGTLPHNCGRHGWLTKQSSFPTSLPWLPPLERIIKKSYTFPDSLACWDGLWNSSSQLDVNRSLPDCW